MANTPTSLGSSVHADVNLGDGHHMMFTLRMCVCVFQLHSEAQRQHTKERQNHPKLFCSQPQFIEARETSVCTRILQCLSARGEQNHKHGKYNHVVQPNPGPLSKNDDEALGSTALQPLCIHLFWRIHSCKPCYGFHYQVIFPATRRTAVHQGQSMHTALRGSSLSGFVQQHTSILFPEHEFHACECRGDRHVLEDHNVLKLLYVVRS